MASPAKAFVPCALAVLATALAACSASADADIALYNDAAKPEAVRGAWQDGVTAIRHMLTAAGLTYEEVDYDDLNASSEALLHRYKVILFPGGYARWYSAWLDGVGKKRIRRFVENGGGYLGICAGAFFACDRISWQGTNYDDSAGYDLDLFPGQGTGPITDIADWDDPDNCYNMTLLHFTNANSVLPAFQPSAGGEHILYYGGPWFSIDPGAEVEVLATYGYGGTAAGKPAAVGFAFGQGRVVLSGPHPEIQEDADVDGVTIDREDEMDDVGSDWELVLHALNWLMEREDLVAPANGGLLESYTSEYDATYAASNLTDGVPSGEGYMWCSTSSPAPQEFIYSFDGGRVARLSHAALCNYAYFSQSCKDFEIWTSTGAVAFTLATNATLEALNFPDAPAFETYALDGAVADRVKIRITSGYDTSVPPFYWEMGELAVYGVLDGTGPPDRDGDRLADTWEIRHFTNVTTCVASDDPDHDGADNGDEEVSGTDPQDAGDVLSVDGILLDTAGRLVLSWDTVSGRVYSVSMATSPAASAAWTAAPGLAETTATGGRASCTNALPPAGPAFYRVGVRRAD